MFSCLFSRGDQTCATVVDRLRTRCYDGSSDVIATNRSLQVRDVGVVCVPAGPCEPPLAAQHGLSINIGSPAWATCREGERPQRHLRVPGGINLVPAGSRSRWTMETPLALLKLRIPPSVVTSIAEDLDLDVRRCALRPAVQVRNAQIEHIVTALYAEAQAGNPNGRLFEESAGHALALLIVRSFAEAAPKLRVQDGRLPLAHLERITQYIDANLGQEDLSLAHLAGVIGMSVSHFKSAFRRSVGVPVHRFVVQRRVERALALLARDRDITEVAFETGFAHATHMARWMRRLLGCTPADLRRHNR